MEEVYLARFRERMKMYCDLVTEKKEPIILKRRDGEDLVVIPLSEYNDIREQKLEQADRVLAYIKKMEKFARADDKENQDDK